MIKQQRRTFAGAVVAELDLSCLGECHRASEAYTGSSQLAAVRAQIACGRGALPACAKPATRTPSRRTGRGGAYSSSKASATRVTCSASQVGAGSVRARVTVEKSSRRTFMPIVRP